MKISSTGSIHDRHHFFLPVIQTRKFTIYSKILAVVVDKQEIGAVDALKRTKTNIEAKGKFNLEYVCSEDDLNVNKEIFDHKNSKISNTVLKTKSLTSKIF